MKDTFGRIIQILMLAALLVIAISQLLLNKKIESVSNLLDYGMPSKNKPINVVVKKLEGEVSITADETLPVKIQTGIGSVSGIYFDEFHLPIPVKVEKDLFSN